MKTKSYKAKSSVRRAAKGMEGFNMDTLEVLQDENGEWYGTDGWGTEEQQEVVLESNEDLETKLEVALDDDPDYNPEDETAGDFKPAETIIEKPNASSIKRPCIMVWEICEQMKGERRGVVLAKCVESGIAYNTARTQYQQWFVASRGETK